MTRKEGIVPEAVFEEQTGCTRTDLMDMVTQVAGFVDTICGTFAMDVQAAVLILLFVRAIAMSHPKNDEKNIATMTEGATKQLAALRNLAKEMRHDRH